MIKNEHVSAYHVVKTFLHSQGKQRFTVPLYRSMVITSGGTRAFAKETFCATQHKLHANVRQRVKSLLEQHEPEA